MPDGYRRGGAYIRNGRTHYRRGTKIKPRTELLVAAGGVVALSAATGGSLVGSPVLIVGVSVLAVSWLVFRNRRRLRPVGRRLSRWAGKRYKKRNTRPVLLARTGNPNARRENYQSRTEVVDGATVRVESWGPEFPLSAKQRPGKEWPGLGMSRPSRPAPEVVTLTKAYDGWKVGDKQCAEHGTGYAPGCDTCRKLTPA